MNPTYAIRRATVADLDTLVAFTMAEARDAEGADVDEGAVTRGMRTGLEDAAVATYWVAETGGGEVVASTSVVTEWSDWRDGHYWWIQSLFIVREHRGRGLVDLLLDHLAKTAREAGAVDLRLYAHGGNQRALDAYRRCGFATTPYTIMSRPLGD